MALPFTAEDFFAVFARYNLSVFPAQFALYAAGLAVVALAWRPSPARSRLAAALLGALWLWTGAVYHIGFFSVVNPAAYLFGALFIVQGLLFIALGAVRGGLAFRWRREPSVLLGAAFAAYALVVYPLLAGPLGHGWPRSPTFGLPCPTTILTFGVLLSAEGTVPRWLLAIPLLWALVGSSAVWSFGVVEDIGLPVAALLGTALLVLRERATPAGPGASAQA